MRLTLRFLALFLLLFIVTFTNSETVTFVLKKPIIHVSMAAQGATKIAAVHAD